MGCCREPHLRLYVVYSFPDLLVNFFFHLPWADSAPALVLLPIVLKQAGETSKGCSVYLGIRLINARDSPP
jgi:hypothetical protein